MDVGGTRAARRVEEGPGKRHKGGDRDGDARGRDKSGWRRQG